MDNTENRMNGAPTNGANPYAPPPAPGVPGAPPPYPPQPVPARPAAPPKEKFAIDKSDLIFAGCILVSTLFGVIAGLWGGFRLGYSAAFALNFILMSAYLIRKKQTPSVFGAVCGALSLAAAAVFAVTSNEIVRFCCVPGGAVLSLFWFLSLGGRKTPAGETGLAAMLLSGLLDAPGHLPQTLRGLFTSEKGGMKKTSRMLLGILCAVPVLCAVIPLLIHSDAAFEGMVRRFFKDLGTVAAQVLLTVGLTPLILSLAFTLRKKDARPGPAPQIKGLPTEFLAAFFGALSLVYVFYLGSQLAYFFDAFRGILPEGYDFSYAEYARRGFFELTAVAGINLLLLYAAILLARKKEDRLPGALKGLGAFISLFTLLLIGTALAKMALYIENYGMTVLRLGTSVFMAFMAIVFFAALVRLFVPGAKILPTAVIAAALALIALGLGNVNRITAAYNYNAYVSSKLPTVDAAYLGTLVPESVPYLVKLAQDETQPATIRRDAANGLFSACIDLYENEFDTEAYRTPFKHHTYYTFEAGYVFTEPTVKTADKPTQWSLPQHRAYAALEDYLKTHPDFLEKQSFFQAVYGGEFSYTDDPAKEPALLYDSVEDFWEALEKAAFAEEERETAEAASAPALPPTETTNPAPTAEADVTGR